MIVMVKWFRIEFKNILSIIMEAKLFSKLSVCVNMDLKTSTECFDFMISKN